MCARILNSVVYIEFVSPKFTREIIHAFESPLDIVLILCTRKTDFFFFEIFPRKTIIIQYKSTKNINKTRMLFERFPIGYPVRIYEVRQ